MRIVGGALKGRIIKCPAGKCQIRPAMDRMKESIFAILGDLSGKSFLDLFSGSASLALEAASRGADRVVLCEKDKKKAKIILENVSLAQKKLQTKIECHFISAELFLNRTMDSFDFAFFDPPFPYSFRKSLVETAFQKKILKPNGILLVHRPKEDPLPEKILGFSKIKTKNYGRSQVDFFSYFD